jgi:hypothetical protein
MAAMGNEYLSRLCFLKGKGLASFLCGAEEHVGTSPSTHMPGGKNKTLASARFLFKQRVWVSCVLSMNPD